MKRLIETIKAVESTLPYNRLVLLVGESGQGKTKILRETAACFGVECVNLNLCLSKILMAESSDVRPFKVLDALRDIVSQCDNGEKPFFIDNIEILFDKSLKTDPLMILNRISRDRTIVTAWNGTFKDGKLTYAECNHPEFKEYDSAKVQEIQIVAI